MTRVPTEIVLRAGDASLVVDSESGGKIRSLSLPGEPDFEFFYQDARGLSSPSDYSRHDMSGYDECFPTVGPWVWEHGGLTIDFGDHGLLWNRRWNTTVRDGEVRSVVEVPEIGVAFSRAIRAAGPSRFLLVYRIEGAAHHSLPFVYSAHPLLRVEADTHVALPPAASSLYVTASSRGPAPGQVIAGTEEMAHLLGPGSTEEESYTKCFSNALGAGTHEVVVEHPTAGRSLTYRFDGAQLPYVGLFMSNGHPLTDGAFRGCRMLAVEPCTSIGDDPAVAESTSSLSRLGLESPVRFHLELEVA